jgi:hypothetical protein
MPKVKRVKNKAQRKTTNEDAKTGSGPGAEQTLSRGQRKRQAKREQYLQRETLILSSLKVQKAEDQKNRIDGLDALKEALVQTMKRNASGSGTSDGNANANAPASTSNKSKKSIAQKELPHLNLVLQHPSFQSNPFGTMQEHLRNTLAQQAQEQEVVASKERMENEKKAAEKKEPKKERIRNAKYEKGRKGHWRRNKTN